MMYVCKIAARGTNVAVRINLSMLARSSRDSSKVGQLLLSAPKREIEISFLFLSASRAPRKTPSAKSGFLLLSGCSLCMSLCPSLCSVPTVALKAAMIDFFLFYAELGSVIRAPFLTDRSISITKSSACSKGAPCSRATTRATPTDRNGTKQAVDEVAERDYPVEKMWRESGTVSACCGGTLREKHSSC